MFSIEKYRYLIKYILSKNFAFKSYKCPKKNGQIYLRHDIDFSPEYALKIALVEAELDIKSTYFFMLSSNTYNCLSKINKEIIEEIKFLGHDISLHFDPSIYNDIHNGLQKEKTIFEDNFSKLVEIVSIHRPGNFLLDNNQKFQGCSHTYEDKFFKELNYISDSGGRDIISRIMNLDIKDVYQILIHPIWWISEHSSPRKSLDEWINHNNRFIIDEVRNNCKSYDN